MKRNRMKSLVIGLTGLSLIAGGAAGILASRVTAAGTQSAVPASSTPLVVELQLNADQRQQMRDIWEAVRSNVRIAFEDAQRLEKQRDDAMVALLDDEQKAKFATISKDYADRFDQLTHRRDQTFSDAVDKTKKLLNEEQRQKYEAILKAHLPPDGEPAFGPAVESPTTQPLR